MQNAMLKAAAAQAAKTNAPAHDRNKEKNYNVPFVQMNGENWEASEQPNAPPGGMGPWAVTLPALLGNEGELRVSSLVVGLRKCLRERVSDGGRRVRARVHLGLDLGNEGSTSDAEGLEHFFLDATNNFRCEYPSLNESPLVVKDGIRVRFELVDDASSADPLVRALEGDPFPSAVDMDLQRALASLGGAGGDLGPAVLTEPKKEHVLNGVGAVNLSAELEAGGAEGGGAEGRHAAVAAAAALVMAQGCQEGLAAVGAKGDEVEDGREPERKKPRVHDQDGFAADGAGGAGVGVGGVHVCAWVLARTHVPADTHTLTHAHTHTHRGRECGRCRYARRDPG